MAPLMPIVMILGIATVVIAVIVISILNERKRTLAMQALAEEMGFEFHPKGDGSVLSRLEDLHLFSQGHSKRITNMFHGEARGIELAILDYKYTVGGGKNSHTYRQSVICFWSMTLSLPLFALRPEHLKRATMRS